MQIEGPEKIGCGMNAWERNAMLPENRVRDFGLRVGMGTVGSARTSSDAVPMTQPIRGYAGQRQESAGRCSAFGSLPAGIFLS